MYLFVCTSLVFVVLKYCTSQIHSVQRSLATVIPVVKQCKTHESESTTIRSLLETPLFVISDGSEKGDYDGVELAESFIPSLSWSMRAL